MLYQTWNKTPVYFKLAVSASYAIEKKFVAFVVDCNNSKAAEVYSSKYEIGKQRHTTEESCAIEKKAHMKKLNK